MVRGVSALRPTGGAGGAVGNPSVAFSTENPPFGRGWRSTYFIVICVAALAYAVSAPPVPDLAAQVARMQAARSGVFLSWTGWFGGLDLPSYSVMSPLFMAVVGVPTAAALAAVTACTAGLWLFRDTPRPRLGATVFAVTVFADVVGGSVSFALGFAAGTLALAGLLSHRPWWACLLVVLTVLLSPLAGLFLGVGAVAVAVCRPSRRTP